MRTLWPQVHSLPALGNHVRAKTPQPDENEVAPAAPIPVVRVQTPIFGVWDGPRHTSKLASLRRFFGRCAAPATSSTVCLAAAAAATVSTARWTCPGLRVDAERNRERILVAAREAFAQASHLIPPGHKDAPRLLQAWERATTLANKS